MARTRERKREDQVSWKINEPEFHPLEADTVLMVNWEQMFFVMYIYIYIFLRLSFWKENVYFLFLVVFLVHD